MTDLIETSRTVNELTRASNIVAWMFLTLTVIALFASFFQGMRRVRHLESDVTLLEEQLRHLRADLEAEVQSRRPGPGSTGSGRTMWGD